MIRMPAVECPHAGCGHYGIPLRGKFPRHSRCFWLCESCRGILPIRTPKQRKQLRSAGAAAPW